jgi:alpha-L-fucosidase 2
MSALKARVGDTEEAHTLLKIFTDAFILRNGFHANGDQSGKGYSGFRYRPFTLEGNFLAMHALNEMLLQSWSPTPGKLDSEVIRIFPTIPESWPDVSFENLRAEGGYRVSAKKSGGKTVWFEITSEKGGELRIKNTFPGPIKWSKPGVTLKGSNYQIQLKAGEKLSGSLQ